MNKLFILLFSTIVLSACGGGESNSTEPSASNSSSSSGGNGGNSSDSNTNTDPIMTDLIIDQKFNLQTEFKILVDAQISATNVRAYLNVCQKSKDTDKADYSNCILRKPLNSGKLNQEVSLSRQDISLVAEIWLYDSNPEPLRYQWQYDENTTQQKFEIRY